MAKHGLGRGLDALIGGNQEDELRNAIQQQADVNQGVTVKQASGSQPELSPVNNLPEGISVDGDGTLWVNPSLLKPNPHQPRIFFDEDKLSELTESVKQEGILSPIIIEDAGDGTFYIIAGERRTRAARAAGLEKVPVQLRKYSDSRKLEVALIENIQRTDLNPVEEAQAYYQIMELENITQDEVARRVGKNRSTVANSIRLLKLPEDMQHALASGSMSSGHARALLSIINPADQRVLFGKIVGQGMSVRQAEQQAIEMNGGSRAAKKAGKSPAPESRDPDYVNIEQKFIDALGTKVQLKGDFAKGSITIQYFTKDDLDRIYNRIVDRQ
ncbi:MAG: ParB/RepB/Spo0J family partition protein [Treponema sp.]|nr:ParB/RepB/Spo0J family partition protein [Treponema sp.]